MYTDNLTELELRALLPGVINLADGHAHQTLAPATQELIRNIVDMTVSGEPGDYFTAERQFLDDLAWHTGQYYPQGGALVTYASSVAMGMVATHLRRLGRPVGVVCPTFDNIPGILRTQDIEPVPVDERDLAPVPEIPRLDRLGLGALIVVAPNNPTGVCPTREGLGDLMTWAAARGVLLVLDTAFRWCDDTMRWDLVRAADDRGADLISIDDTGKALAFSDMKAAVIGASRRLAAPMRAIHTQYVLNVSEMGLRVISAMLNPSSPDNEIARARRLVAVNRALLDAGIAALDGPDPRMPARNDALSVEWLALPGRRDRVLAACRARGVEVLAGDHFLWADGFPGRGTYVRLALMRDPDQFAQGADVVLAALSER